MTITTALGTSRASTRLSLYKLFLPTTKWVSITPVEYARILAWLERNRSRTSRRNAVDKLYETFLWFPTFNEDSVYVPLGHLTRFFAQIEDRIPAFATSEHPNVRLRHSLRRARVELSGDYILVLRLASALESAAQ